MAKKKAKAKRKVAKKAKRKTVKKKKKKAKAKRKPIMHAKAAREELKRKPNSQKKNPIRLTARQTLFVDCYIGAARMNGTKAAIMAGYSEHSASRQATDLLTNPLVKTYLHRRQADLKRRLEVTQDKVVGLLSAVAQAKATDFVTWKGSRIVVKSSDEIPDALVSAVKSVKPVFDKDGCSIGIELRFHDPVAAARLLGQHLNLFGEKARGDNKGIIIEAMEGLHAQADKLGEGEKDA